MELTEEDSSERKEAEEILLSHFQARLGEETRTGPVERETDKTETEKSEMKELSLSQSQARGKEN